MTISGRGVPFVRSIIGTKPLSRSSGKTIRCSLTVGGGERLFSTTVTKTSKTGWSLSRLSQSAWLRDAPSFRESHLRSSRRTLSSAAAATVSAECHPLDPLLPDEITRASDAVREHLGVTRDDEGKTLRFVSISLLEPPKKIKVSRSRSAKRTKKTSPNFIKKRAESVPVIKFQLEIKNGEVKEK